MIYSNYFEFICVIFIMIETEPSGTYDTNDLALKYRFSRIIHIHIFLLKYRMLFLKILHFIYMSISIKNGNLIMELFAQKYIQSINININILISGIITSIVIGKCLCVCNTLCLCLIYT